MRILIIHEIDWINKVPFEPHHLAEIFSIKGHDVFVIDCAEPNLSNIKNGLSTRIIKQFNRLYDDASITLIRPSSILVKGLNRITHFLSCKKIIKNILSEKNIDIILLYGVATNGIQTIQVAKELGIPVIFRALDVAHELVKIPLLQHQAKKHEKIVIKNAAKVLATTPELVKYTEEMGATDSEYFPLGINSEFFKPMEKNSALASELEIKNSDQVIGFVGTIYPFAGLDNLLNQFENIRKKIPNIKFLIIGGGSYFKNIKSLVKELNLESNVVLTGFVNQKDLSEYISLFDLCVNPFVINSITNRILPTKILEYMACKKPVLSTPLKGTIELLPDENFGIVYSNLDNFAFTIIDLLQDQEKLNFMGENGYNHIQKHHSWNILADNLIEMFNKTILK